MFERTLQDLIRGLRALKGQSKATEDAFLASALDEIRQELRGKDLALKADAVLKMCYLMMLYPIPPPPSFAFHVVEVMSSPRYHIKQLGYLAAPMAFSSGTEEVVLTVNGLKKDLLSSHVPIPPLPLAALPSLLPLSSSLALALSPDISHLLSHSAPQIRKRAVLALLPLFIEHPPSLQTYFSRMRDRLRDDDPGVVGATVNVLTELARRMGEGAKQLLPLAPELFGILTESSNNWMLIKVVKLFAILTPLEPRLIRKLLPPLTSLISSTSAISLLYECVRTCIIGGMLDDSTAGDALARVCVEKLSGFLVEEDQNLKYIALLAMVRIVPSHPQMVAEYQEDILKSVDDQDVSIRMRALELVSSMVTRRNLQPIVTQLLSHLAPPTDTVSALPSAVASLALATSAEQPSSTAAAATSTLLTPAYRLEVVRRILHMFATDTYDNVTDFEWVLSVLIDLAYISNVDAGEDIKEMILDIVARVRDVRGYAVAMLSRVLRDDAFIEGARDAGSCGELVYAAAWVSGEYSRGRELSETQATIRHLLQPSVAHLPPATIAVCIHSAAKAFGHWAAEASERWSKFMHEDAQELVAFILQALIPYRSSGEIEVQERAANISQLFQFIEADLAAHKPPSGVAHESTEALEGMDEGFASSSGSNDPPFPKSLFLLQPLFTSYEMTSVAYKAQESVRIPDGVDLDTEIVAGGGFAAGDDEDEESDGERDDGDELGDGGGSGMEALRKVIRGQEGDKSDSGKKKKSKPRVKANGEVETKEERAKRKAATAARHKDDPYYLKDQNDEDIEAIPIVRLDDEMEAGPSTPSEPKKKKKKARQPTPPPIVIDKTGEMPEGASVPSQSKPAAVSRSTANTELAAVDLSSSMLAQAQASRFDEYQVDEELAAPQPAAVGVVKVKRKKKKTVPSS